MKVVKNVCYGGYGLSNLALLRLSKLTGKSRKECEEYYCWGCENEKRTDPALVQVVEELGEAANDNCARLMVVEIPDDVDWVIEEYDGWETIEEVHRSW